jgi:hypothetical protein
MRFPASSRHFIGILIYPTECELSGFFSFAPVLLQNKWGRRFFVAKKSTKKDFKNFFEKGVKIRPSFCAVEGCEAKTPHEFLEN